LAFTAQIRVPYQCLQSEKDHVQPDVGHAVHMVNAALEGGAPWVRLNDLPPNQTYDPADPPVMLPEGQSRDLATIVAQYAQELLGQIILHLLACAQPLASAALLAASSPQREFHLVSPA